MIRVLTKNLLPSFTILYSIDYPVLDGNPQPGLCVTIGGWAYCAEAPLVAVALYASSLPRSPLAMTSLHRRDDVSAALGFDPTLQSGFSISLNMIGLHPGDEIIVATLNTDQYNAHLVKPAYHSHNFDEVAAIRIDVRLERQSAALPRVLPVFVTSQGRSGSSALTRALLGSPFITAVDEAPWEARILSYFLTLTRMAVSPANGMSRGDNEVFSDIYTGAINNPFLNPADYPRLYSEMSENSLELARGLADAFLDTALRTLGKAMGNISPSERMLFIEKSTPGSIVPNISRALWPATKEIFLSREAEDWFLSGVRFSERTDRYFGQDLIGDLENFSREIETQIKVGIAYFERHKDVMIHIKYDDLVDRPARTLARLSHHLEVPIPDHLAGIAGTHATIPTPTSERIYAELQKAHPQIIDYFARWNETFGHSASR